MMIDGRIVEVPGVRILPVGAEPWNVLARGQKRSYKPSFKIIHKTIADDPEKILEGPAPASADGWGGARDTLSYWQQHRDKQGKLQPLSGTHLITGHDGSTLNPADLYRFIGWHAGSYDADANPRSWGHEIKELFGGGVRRQALKACVEITFADTNALGVQQQIPKAYKKNTPNPRFRNGGRDIVGVHGHRDVTHDRGHHDPGDEIWRMLAVAGFEVFDFYAGEDLDVWAKRQAWLREEGHYHGAIDGIAGQMTTSACLVAGLPGGIWARWVELAEQPFPQELHR